MWQQLVRTPIHVSCCEGTIYRSFSTRLSRATTSNVSNFGTPSSHIRCFSNSARRRSVQQSKPQQDSKAPQEPSSSTPKSPPPRPSSKVDPIALAARPKKTNEALPPLPILPRPLGVEDPPNPFGPTEEQRKKDLLDKEKHMEKRRFLVKQVTTGYYEDLIATMKNGYGGKMWLAPKAVIKEDKALYFPDIAGTSLNKEKVCTTLLGKGRISIITIIPTQAAQEHVQSFVEHTIPELETVFGNKFRYIQINLQENFAKLLLVNLARSSIRKAVPEQFHSSYMVSSQNVEMLRGPTGMQNKHLGFVYLVDDNLKIRWAGCGYAKDEEKVALKSCAFALLDRLPEPKPDDVDA